MGQLKGRHLLAAMGLAGLVTTFAAIGFSADGDLGLGSGKDGPLVANAVDQVVNAYAAVTAAASVGATTVTVDATDDFAVGDVVLVVQIRGGELASTTDDPPAALDLAAVNAGQYDVVKVTAKNATTLTVSPALKSAYGATGAQVVRVPQYTTVGVPEGTSLTAKPWDGTTGGVLAFLATGNVTMAGTGTVHASARGFRGGNRSIAYCLAPCNASTVGAGDADDATCVQGGRGESFDERISAYGETGCGVGARGTGGGGGGHINAGGAGGGNGGPGGRGGNAWNDQAPYGGFPGAAVDASLAAHLTFGGGGGGGQSNDSPAPDDASNVSRGGAGGGVVWFRGASLTAEAPIEANGARGFDGVSDGAGGGGAGGSVLIRVVGEATCAGVRANGGDGGNIVGHGAGGPGGPGRVRVDARSGVCNAEAVPGVIGVGNTENVNVPGESPRPVVENAEPYGCVDAGECPAASPICDATMRVCRTCSANAECATGFCATDGACKPPPADAGSSSSSSGDASSPSSSSSSGDASGSSSSSSSGSSGADATPPSDEVTPSVLEGGGCGCKTTGTSSAGTTSFAAAAALAASLAFRRRRSAAAKDRA